MTSLSTFAEQLYRAALAHGISANLSRSSATSSPSAQFRAQRARRRVRNGLALIRARTANELATNQRK